MNVTTEKIGLLLLAAAAVIGVILLAALTLHIHGVDPNAAGLVGVVVGGLVAFAKDIIAALRSYSTAAQMNRMSDQLASAAPVTTQDSPQDAKEAARQTADAADDKATQIEGAK
jgi:hypothetical protein